MDNTTTFQICPPHRDAQARKMLIAASRAGRMPLNPEAVAYPPMPIMSACEDTSKFFNVQRSGKECYEATHEAMKQRLEYAINTLREALNPANPESVTYLNDAAVDAVTVPNGDPKLFSFHADMREGASVLKHDQVNKTNAIRTMFRNMGITTLRMSKKARAALEDDMVIFYSLVFQGANMRATAQGLKMAQPQHIRDASQVAW